MKLRVRLLVLALLAALPAAVLIYVATGWLRARDARTTLDRFITSQLTDDTRQRCDENANWFLAGPRPDRPSPQQLAAPDADVTAPRPPVQELPFEYYAFDSSFQPLSTAGPRFPTDLRQAIRSGAKRAMGPFDSDEGRGYQGAVLTEWSGSNCAVLLFRMRALPNQTTERLAIALGLAILLVGIAFVPGYPIVARVRRLGVEARRAAADEYRSTVDVGGHDEMSSIAFAFNEAASDIRRRATDTKDREDSLRRYIVGIEENVAGPLQSLEERLSELQAKTPPPLRDDVNAAVIDAHTLTMRAANLSVAAALKMSMESKRQEPIDLTAAVSSAVERQSGFARASGVSIEVTTLEPFTVPGDRMWLEQAIDNLIDNAIRYNRPGGHVMVTLDRTRDGRFSLRVEDDGPGAPEEVLAKLNANRRFRGDEGRARQPGELGLGLAIVREVGDRLGIRWVFRRSARGWFQAELTGQ